MEIDREEQVVLSSVMYAGTIIGAFDPSAAKRYDDSKNEEDEDFV